MSPDADNPSTVSRIGAAVAAITAILGQGAERIGVRTRLEVHRAASIIALLLFASVCACAAAGFAAAAVLAAFGTEHRILGASLIAGGFALLALLAAYRARATVAARKRSVGER